MSQPLFSTYQPDKVSFVFGSLIITGFAQDSMITVARKTPIWTSTAGSQGYVTRTKNMDKRGDVTIVLDQSSPDNDALSALCVADELTGQGAQPFMMRDASGTSVASAASMWIVQPATMEFGAGVLGRTWTFEAAVLIMTPGGNS